MSETDYEILIQNTDPESRMVLRSDLRITDPWPNQPVYEPPMYSHYDRTAHPELGIAAMEDYNSAYQKLDEGLADSIGHTGPIGTFIRGYSGFTWPETFQQSTVSIAPSLGIGAMLNVKSPSWTEWESLATGGYDRHIRRFFQSWPQEVFGSLTVNHEPEDDAPESLRPYNNRNPIYIEWAKVYGPIWSRGIARVIRIAAPIIRQRNLDVRIGGCLMEYSWDPYTLGRYALWNWWDYVDPQFHDVTEFQIDIYAQSINTTPVSYNDLIPRMITCLEPARQAGIDRWSIFESSVSQTEWIGGGNHLGDYDSQAIWWKDYTDRLATIGGARLFAHFSLPDEPVASDLREPVRSVFAQACLDGARPLGWT